MPTKKTKTAEKTTSPTRPTKSCYLCGFYTEGIGCRLVSANCVNTMTRPSYIDRSEFPVEGRPEFKSEKVLLSFRDFGKVWKGIDK